MPKLPEFISKKRSISIGLLAVSTVLLLTVQMIAIYFIADDYRWGQYNSEANEALSRCAGMFERIIKDAEQTAVVISKDLDVSNMLFAGEVSSSDQWNLSNAVRKYTTRADSSISSLYVFNDSTGTLYGFGYLSVPVEQLPEGITKDMILAASGNRRFTIFSGSPDFVTYGESSSAGGQQAIRIKFSVSRTDNSCVLLDVAARVVNDVFRDFVSGFGGDIYVVDAGGSMLFGTRYTAPPIGGGDIEELAAVSFDSPVIRTWGGREYLVLRNDCVAVDLSLYMLIPTDSIKFGSVEAKILVWTNLIVAAAAILLICLVFVFRRVYSMSGEAEKRRRTEEQEEIHRRFQKSKKHIVNCLYYPEKQDIVLAREYLASVFGEDEGLWREIAVIRMDIARYPQFREKYDRNDIRLFKYGMLNICEEVLSRHFKATAVHEYDGTILFVAGFPDGSDYAEKCRGAFAECQDAVHAYIQTELFAFVSQTGRLEELYDLNAQTERLSEYAFMLEKPSFLSPSFLKTVKKMDFQEVAAQADTLLNQMRFGKQDTQAVDAYLEALRSYDVVDVKNILLNFLFRMKYMADGLPGSRDDSAADMDQLITQFGAIDSFREMKAFLMETLESIMRPDRDENGERFGHLVKKAGEIIDADFTDPMLSSDVIADRIGLSKQYVSRVFKSHTGLSIGDALNKKRLDESAELLLTTDKTVKTVISEVGISNYNYFMVLFKKEFQMTPSEYRHRYREITE